MTAWITDENFKSGVVAGVINRLGTIDLVSIEGLGLRGAPDPLILQRAAEEARVLLTHDQDTMPGFAYRRLAEGLSMPGVVVVPWLLGVGRTVSELEIVMGAGTPADFNGQVRFLPAR